MEHFWPTFPFIVPASQGLPLWWDISWWIFQIVVMSGVLFLITKWALRVDKMLKLTPSNDKEETKKQSNPTDKH